MKSFAGRLAAGSVASKQRKNTKSAEISRILRTAYQLHFKDKDTKAALKRGLG